MTSMRNFVSIVAVLLTACSTATQQPVQQPNPIPIQVTVELPRDVHWFRDAAEYRASAIQTYRAATERMRALASGRPSGSWAVILDVDETVLDNSEYQKRLAARNASFASDTWNAWVREEAATAIPGAAAFIREARTLGGRVALVTNRDEEMCAATRANLQRLTIVVDAVLCRSAGVSDKNPRFEAVAGGTAVSGLGPATVLVWVGDNIQDFPRLTQEIRLQGEEAFDAFGKTLFMLPNPMYGSWERNPPR
jgi:5'-nucleotidase (lipoprotein e(P4) family)